MTVLYTVAIEAIDTYHCFPVKRIFHVLHFISIMSNFSNYMKMLLNDT